MTLPSLASTSFPQLAVTMGSPVTSTPSLSPMPSTKQAADPLKTAIALAFTEHTQEILLAGQIDLLCHIANQAFHQYEDCDENPDIKFNNIRNAHIKKKYQQRLPHKAHIFYVSKDQFRMYLKLPEPALKFKGCDRRDALCITFTRNQLPTFKKVTRSTGQLLTNVKDDAKRNPDILEHKLLKKLRKISNRSKANTPTSQIEDWAKYVNPHAKCVNPHDTKGKTAQSYKVVLYRH